MTTIAYVDASALVKLVIASRIRPTMLRWYVEAERVVTSRIGVIETRRAVARRDHDRERLRRVLGRGRGPRAR